MQMDAKDWVAYLVGCNVEDIPPLGETRESRFAYAAIQIAEIALREQREHWRLAAAMFPHDPQIRAMAKNLEAHAEPKR